MPDETVASPQGLPQRFDVWQADARPLALPNLPEQPWLIAVASRTDGQIVTYELARELPDADALWQALEKAMLRPETSDPHRPTEVQVCRPEWCAPLCGRLEALGVTCTSVETLDAIDEVFEEFSGSLAVQEEPGLLDVPGATPAAVGSFFDAAALFYEQAPWTKTGERPIKVECGQFDSGPWYAVVVGQGGVSTGMLLYDKLDTLRHVERADVSDEQGARATSGLVVAFGMLEDLPAADRAALQQHGWRVAGEHAYPTVYRLEPGLNMRPPLLWELQLMEGCLRAVSEFLRKKTRRRAPLPVSVPTAGGELTLVLCWEDA